MIFKNYLGANSVAQGESGSSKQRGNVMNVDVKELEIKKKTCIGARYIRVWWRG